MSKVGFSCEVEDLFLHFVALQSVSKSTGKLPKLNGVTMGKISI